MRILIFPLKFYCIYSDKNKQSYLYIKIVNKYFISTLLGLHYEGLIDENNLSNCSYIISNKSSRKYFNINHSVVQDVLDRRTWCYLTENLIITKPSQKGSGHPNSKLNEQQVLEIKKRLLNGEKQKSIGNDFGVPQQTISDIKNGRSWRHLNV